MHQVHLFISEGMAGALDEIAKQGHFEFRTSALAHLLQEYRKSKSEVTEATYQNVMAEAAPVVISGLAGSGKTFTLTKFARQAARQFAVIFIDSVSEQKRLPGRKITPMRAIVFNPRPRGFYVIRPEVDPVSRRLTMKRVFERLSMLQLKGKLNDCVVCVDEANEYSQSKAFLNFIVESRKFTRKVVVVSTDQTLFENICKVMKPIQKSGAD